MVGRRPAADSSLLTLPQDYNDTFILLWLSAIVYPVYGSLGCAWVT